MEEKKEIWMDSVLRSMEGSSRVKPHANLFDQIEQRIDQSNVKSVQPTISLRSVAAVGALLLAVNSYFLTQKDTFRNIESDLAYSQDYFEDYSLVTNYKLYE